MSERDPSETVYELFGEDYLPHLIEKRRADQLRPDSYRPKPQLNDIETHVIEFGLGDDNISIQSITVLHNASRCDYQSEGPLRTAGQVLCQSVPDIPGLEVRPFVKRLPHLRLSESPYCTDKRPTTFCPSAHSETASPYSFGSTRPKRTATCCSFIWCHLSPSRGLLKVKKVTGFDSTFFISQNKSLIGINMSPSAFVIIPIGSDINWHCKLSDLSFIVQIDVSFVSQPISRLVLSEDDGSIYDESLLAIFFETGSLLVYRLNHGSRSATVIGTLQANQMDIELLGEGQEVVGNPQSRLLHSSFVPEYGLLVRCLQEGGEIFIEKSIFQNLGRLEGEVRFERQAVITKEEGCEYRFSELKLDLFQKILLVVYKASAEGVFKAIFPIDSRQESNNPFFKKLSVTELVWTPDFPKETGVRLQSSSNQSSRIDPCLSGLKGTSFIMLSNNNQAIVQKI
jgi:hypothetical protein